MFREINGDTLQFGELEWGYPQTIYHGDPEDLKAGTPGRFRAMVRLRSTAGTSREVDIVDASPSDLLDGDSNYMVPAEKRVTHLEQENGPTLSVKAHVN